jgi:hypothetical protein
VTRRRAATGVAAAALAAAALAGGLSADGSGHAGHAAAAGTTDGPEGVLVPVAPALAPAASPALGRSVDGIACGPTEQLAFHIHAHLTIFVNGSARVVPPGVGIAPPLDVQTTSRGPYAAGGECFSFLHTHAADGIIHIESPVERSYTVGQFFDVWRQPLGRDRVGPAAGHITAFVDGRRYHGDPRSIPLHAHAQIQLDLGEPVVAPGAIRFPQGL